MQSWNRLSPLFPRGAASLGAALGTGRGRVFCARFPFPRHCEAPSGAVAIRPFSGDREGRPYSENVGLAIPRGYPRGGPQFHLAALPFPGLLRDGPPKARLRSGESAFLCHRQRRLLRPPLAVSNGVVLRRGRIRNLPLLSVFSFPTFLWTSKEKLIARIRSANRRRKRIHPSASRCSAPSLAGEATEKRIAAAPDGASQ